MLLPASSSSSSSSGGGPPALHPAAACRLPPKEATLTTRAAGGASERTNERASGRKREKGGGVWGLAPASPPPPPLPAAPPPPHARVPSRGGLSARLPGLFLFPVRKGGEEGKAEPRSLCQPRLGHRGLRGQRRRRKSGPSSAKPAPWATRLLRAQVTLPFEALLSGRPSSSV